MSIYCDTSLLVAALVGEDASDRVLEWLAEKAGEKLVISDWCVTEFSSAVSLKLRSGAVDTEQWAETLAALATLREASLETVSVGASNFLIAADFCGRAELGLRAGDALHLAIAAAHGHSIATLDAAQANAALGLGIPVEPI